MHLHAPGRSLISWRSMRWPQPTLPVCNRMKRVNHSEAYSNKDGDNTNFVESFFSRVECA